jgi:hypothetical protein
MPSIPSPLRAALGLAVSTVEGLRHLPDKAIELPMSAVSTALQCSLKAQQHYAQLVARGDEVLQRGAVTDEPPAWATFDGDADEGPADERAPISLLDRVEAGSGYDASAASKFDTVIFEEDEEDLDGDEDGGEAENEARADDRGVRGEAGTE